MGYINSSINYNARYKNRFFKDVLIGIKNTYATRENINNFELFKMSNIFYKIK